MEFLGFIIVISFLKSIFGFRRRRHCHFFSGLISGLFLSSLFRQERPKNRYNGFPYDNPWE